MANEENNKSNGNISRRDILKGLAGVPVIGLLGVGAGIKYSGDQKLKNRILNELDVKAGLPPPTGSMSGDPIRLGIIGYGIRGPHLLRASGYAHPKWLEAMAEGAEKNPRDTRLKDFLAQEDMNTLVTGVCDIFDTYAEMGIEAGTRDGNKPKRYRNYMEMMESPDIDAVIIATPDHWHAPMAIAAARNGKHVYLEKPMTHSMAETYELRKAVRETGIVLQVGHQHRQTQSFLTAQDVISKNVLGHISLIQTNTNRNDDNGAWQYNIHEDANPNTIDWEQFLGNAKPVPFNLEHFFRWRKWWAYGTGLSGDLLTHDYDRINCVLDMGIPKTVMSSGGIYTHRDGREVPDVFQSVMEYPDFSSGTSQKAGKEKGMTFMYSATLGSEYPRGTILMGHDGTMELGNDLVIYADPRSTRFNELIENGTIDTSIPLYSYDPRAKGLDGVTSATSKYFANKGLMYTYRDGKRVDSTFLHIREWLSAIRNGHDVSCSINEGFEEAVAAHMGTLSLKTGRRIEWDHENEVIKDFEIEEIDKILVSSDYEHKELILAGG